MKLLMFISRWKVLNKFKYGLPQTNHCHFYMVTRRYNCRMKLLMFISRWKVLKFKYGLPQTLFLHQTWDPILKTYLFILFQASIILVAASQMTIWLVALFVASTILVDTLQMTICLTAIFLESIILVATSQMAICLAAWIPNGYKS